MYETRVLMVDDPKLFSSKTKYIQVFLPRGVFTYNLGQKHDMDKKATLSLTYKEVGHFLAIFQTTQLQDTYVCITREGTLSLLPGAKK